MSTSFFGPRCASLALALLLGLPAAARAQVAGDTVRIRYRDTVLVNGIFLNRDSLGIAVRPLGTTDTVSTLAGEHIRFEVLRGYHRAGMRAVGRGAAIGAGIGLTIAAASLAIGGGSRSNESSAGLAVIVLPALGAGLGMLHGAAIGFVADPVWEEFGLATATERGEPIPVPDRGSAGRDTVYVRRDSLIARAVGYGAVGGLVAGVTYGVLTHETGMPAFLGALGLLAGTIVSLPATFIPASPWVTFDPLTMTTAGGR